MHRATYIQLSNGEWKQLGDLEDGGVRLNRSRLYQPDRLSRLAGGACMDVRVADACRGVGR